MADPLIQNVSDTAFMVATYRAMEMERPDALFHDPLAAKLAGEHGKAIVADMRRGARFGAWLLAIRTHIIDAYIRSAIDDGIDTIVNLGAGLDTRPYRMGLPASLHWIEVDFPAIVALKEDRLADEIPSCRLDRIALDLAKVEKRRQLFAEIAGRSDNILVLTEGVVPYLSNDDVGALADALHAQPAFRYWIVDYLSAQALHHHRRHRENNLKMKNAPFKFDPPDYFSFFREHGWQAKETLYIPQEAERLKRPIALPFVFRLWIMLGNLLAREDRRNTFRKSFGYVMFQPIA